MTISWKRYGKGDDGRRVVTEEWTTHEGLVVGAEFSRDVRVMSDIWAIGYFCEVFNPDTGEVETLRVSTCFELETVYGRVTAVDAPEAVLAAIKAKAAQAKAKASNRRALARHNEVTKGKTVVVKGGRKHVGATGKVFWIGANKFGPGTRCGLRTGPHKADVVWVNTDYCMNAAPFAPAAC